MGVGWDKKRTAWESEDALLGTTDRDEVEDLQRRQPPPIGARAGPEAHGRIVVALDIGAEEEAALREANGVESYDTISL